MIKPKPARATAAHKPLLFFIGRNSKGNWVTQDQYGCCGGLFAERAQALRFVMSQKGRGPQEIVTVPGVFELDLNLSRRRAAVRKHHRA